MVGNFIALLKCSVDYGLCMWAFSWFSERRCCNNIAACGSTFLLAFFLFCVNRLGMPLLNTVVSVFSVVLLFLAFFVTQWREAMISACLLVALCVICEFIPPLALSSSIGSSLFATIEGTINNAAFNMLASGLFYTILRLGRLALNCIYGKANAIYVNSSGWASIFPIMSLLFVYYILYTDTQNFNGNKPTVLIYGILFSFILIANIGFFLGEIGTEKEYLLAEKYKQLKFEQQKTEALMVMQEMHINEMKRMAHDFEAQLNGLQSLATKADNTSIDLNKGVEEVRESIQETNRFYFVTSKALQFILNQL